MISQSLIEQVQYDAVMGFVPSENADVIKSNADDLAAIIYRETGLRVKIFIAASYNTLIEAMRADQIDFGWFPPFAYVKAEQFADAELLLKTVRNGMDYYYSAIIVRKDSGIKDIYDLRGKTIAWTQPGSAGGYIFPKADLIRKGILKSDDDQSFFGRELNAGGHDAVVISVFNGKVDAGATFANDNENISGAWHRYLPKPEDQEEVHAIFYTDEIPNDVFAVKRSFKESNPLVTEKVTQVIMNLHNSEQGRKILVSIDREKMVPATSEEYEIVRDAGRLLNIDE